MSSKHPDRFEISDWRRFIFRSRPVFVFIFLTVLLISVLLISQKSVICQSIGASLFASAIVALATMWIDQLRTSEQSRADEIFSSGLIQVFNRRDLEEYVRHLQGFQQIDVTGYTLRAFVESNEALFRDRAKQGHTFQIRMIVVDPKSDTAVAMEAAEKLPPGSYERSLASILQKLAGLHRHVEIRIISRSLPMMVYRIDNIMYTGPYPHIGSSRSAVTFKLIRSGWLYSRQQDEFEALWQLGTRKSL